MDTLIGLQQEYIDNVNSAKARWAHRKDGGHSRRTIGAAHKRLRNRLTTLGFSQMQIDAAIKDARDIAELERIAEDVEE